MSETLLTVVITGSVTLLAAFIGQWLAGRNARLVAREQRRANQRAELLPRVTRAVTALDELALAWWRMHRRLSEAAAEALTDEVLEALPATVDELEMRTRAALTELRLTTLDPGVQRAASIAQITVESARMQMSAVVFEVRSGGAPDWSSATSGVSGIEKASGMLVLAAQRLTAARADGPWWRSVWRRRAEEGAVLDAAAAADSANFVRAAVADSFRLRDESQEVP